MSIRRPPRQTHCTLCSLTGAVATPVDLIDALTQYGKEAKLQDVKICHLHTEVHTLLHIDTDTRGPQPTDQSTPITNRSIPQSAINPHNQHQGTAPYVSPECKGIFHTTCFFVGPNMRKPVAEGRAEYMPIFLSEIPNLFRRRVLPVDVALVQVSPPDKHGYCSLGAWRWGSEGR